jgi:O-antigen ligase
MLVLIVRFQGLLFFKRHMKGIIYLVAVLALITGIFSTSNPINISQRTVTERAAAGLAAQEVSVRQRLMIWDISLLMVKDHPIVGQGLGTYKYHYLWYQGEYFENPSHDDVIHLAVWAREAHNEYVQILAELGIVGFAVWMWLLITFFRGRYKTLGKERQEEEYFFPRLGFTMGALVVLVHAVVSFPLHIVPNGLLLFLLMGLAASGWHKLEKTGSNLPEEDAGG